MFDFLLHDLKLGMHRGGTFDPQPSDLRIMLLDDLPHLNRLLLGQAESCLKSRHNRRR